MQVSSGLGVLPRVQLQGRRFGIRIVHLPSNDGLVACKVNRI